MTTRRIELFGPSGVGKSTTLANALHLLALRGHAAAVIGPRAQSRHHDAVFHPLPLDRKRRAIEALAVTPLVDLALELAGRLRASPETRLMLLDNFLGSLRRMASALTLPGPLLVQDELLLRRGFSFLPLSETPLADARAWFSLVPLPNAAVFCFAPPPVIATRFAGRGEVVLSHDAPDAVLSPARLAALADCYDVACGVLQARGLRLHHLDLGGTPDEAAEALAAVLEAEIARAD